MPTPPPTTNVFDYASWQTNATSLPTAIAVGSSETFNVALVLGRANDPTALLESNWATRQAAIADQATIWATYGADPGQYAALIAAVNGLNGGGASLTVLDPGKLDLSSPPGTPQPQYITTEASRTVWVQVNASGFKALFGTDLLVEASATGATPYLWSDPLTLAPTVAASGVQGIWFDFLVLGNYANPKPESTPAAPLAQGWQSPGNAAPAAFGSNLPPQEIAASYYNFPLTGSSVATGTIGLIEPGVGTALLAPSSATFEEGLGAYRAAIGLPSDVNVVTVAPGGQVEVPVTPPAFNPAGERSMDFAVVTAINPKSTLVAYAGSGQANGARANPYTAYQGAFWDTANNPKVITSSFNLGDSTAPGSPFLYATSQLFIDAALRGITMFNDNGDMGSSNSFGNGIANTASSHSSPYAVLVGGTSLSSQAVAATDLTLDGLVAAASTLDPATLWQLIAGGMTQLPTAGNAWDAQLVETVWNQYVLLGNLITNSRGTPGTGYLHNNTGSSGVDASQPVPNYQAAFGLNPTTAGKNLPGRGTPDVAANAGGNLYYTSPTPNFYPLPVAPSDSNPEGVGLQGGGGTSAATPLWAALATQINAVFADQGLPNLGYMNDLLYIAAAIAPASFNDITIGDSTSSFFFGGDYLTPGTSAADPFVAITPTGLGYQAGPGYDYVSGLGTPNGLLLARALTLIAHQQTSFGGTPHLVDSDGVGGWRSGTDQALLVQSGYADPVRIDLSIGGTPNTLQAGDAMAFAWTALMAQQSLQAQFDPNLVRLFDSQSQGGAWQVVAGAGEAVAVSVGGTASSAPRAGMTAAFGMADFLGSSGSAVHLAQAVAVAETVNALDDQIAVVRMRQVGRDNLAVTLYRVDDATGQIGGVAPGDAGYAAAADGRAYLASTGGTSFAGPGYGLFAQGQISGVDAGDLVAMKLSDLTTGSTYWGFAAANADGVQHLWNYGVNTWGWEDTYGGGDRDYNDLVVQLDFTSAYGRGWLA